MQQFVKYRREIGARKFRPEKTRATIYFDFLKFSNENTKFTIIYKLSFSIEKTYFQCEGIKLCRSKEKEFFRHPFYDAFFKINPEITS